MRKDLLTLTFDSAQRIDGPLSDAERTEYLYWWRNLCFRYSSYGERYEVPMGATSIRPCDWR